MKQREYYVKDLAEAKARAAEWRRKKTTLTDEDRRERDEIARKAAEVFEHYERDLAKKLELEDRERRNADYFYAQFGR